MKKSFMSVSTLVVSISMIVMLVCTSSVANAQTKEQKFVYDKKENVETVYTLDETGRYLTPKLKYEFQKDTQENTVTKTAYRWNAENKAWNPYYQIVLIEGENESELEYACWNKETKDFSLNIQKAVYEKDFNNDLLTYVFYKWTPETESWQMNQQLLFKNYIAGVAAPAK